MTEEALEREWNILTKHENRIIFRTLFGSHLYGTDTQDSDRDYKSIFLPKSRDLVLQRASKHIELNTKADSNKKNTTMDVDDEAFSLQEYLKLLCDGQTVALDMLFAPNNMLEYSSDIFKEIKKNKDKILHKGLSAFVGYTKAQAAKYGVKGFRVRALKDTVELFEQFLSQFPQSSHEKLEVLHGVLEEFVKTREHVAIISIIGGNGKPELALEICSRKFPFHNSIGYVLDCIKKIYENYGQRALMAEKNEGIDWKALSHAVRVAREAEELLLTGNITFPRPEKDLLLKIKKGEMDYKDVSALIEEGLVRVKQAQEKSNLRESPDREWIDDFVYRVYLDRINMNRFMDLII